MIRINDLSAIVASVIILTSAGPAHASGCELYCDSKAPDFIRNCLAAGAGEDDCNIAWDEARRQCLDSQCRRPDPSRTPAISPLAALQTACAKRHHQ